MIATARIYNDRRSFDGGTFGQFVPAQPLSAYRTAGTLPMLANRNPKFPNGSRTNVGFFNASGRVVAATFDAHRPNGAIAASRTLTIFPWAQQQLNVAEIFEELGEIEAMYVTFSTTGAPLYVYASVVDNATGDAIFVPAQ